MDDKENKQDVVHRFLFEAGQRSSFDLFPILKGMFTPFIARVMCHWKLCESVSQT